MPRVNNKSDSETEIDYSDDTEMHIQMEEASDSHNKDNAITSPASHLYSMSADELMGMTVVANNNEEIGYVSNIVLSPDESEVHAVISIGSILSKGGRDILASLDELTLVNDDLRIKADEGDIEAMNEHGSNDFVELESDAALSTANHFT
ncbi:MAG: PRC-barrel domain-containing protein [Methylophaga sp.]|nr:PRC-barrel domain-containing protein [Methylophaga sp.]